MGLYDSVFVNCPKCGAQVEFQTKAGECRLKQYTHISVPSGIAEYLNGSKERCECGARVQLFIQEPPGVVMDAIIVGEPQEWD